MHTVKALNTLKSFLEEQVSPKIKLQKASDDNVLAYELVHPSVHIGWLPLQGYIPEELGSIPCLIVGMENGANNSEESDFNIKISFAVWSPGEHTNEGQYTPSFNGYVDLLNLIDLTKAQLSKQSILDKYLKISDEIKWSMYQEQPYPYWYGYMTFSIQGKSYPNVQIEKLLNE